MPYTLLIEVIGVRVLYELVQALYSLPFHLRLAGDRLVVAHGGIAEELIGERRHRAPVAGDLLALLAEHARPHLGLLLVTHYRKILEYLTPDRIHILIDGRIVADGGPELAAQVEAEGFDGFRNVTA